MRHEAYRCRCSGGADRACLRRRRMSQGFSRRSAAPLRRRLCAARLRGDGLSRAALVSVPAIISGGVDYPSRASRPPCLEEAGLCGEDARFDAQARLRFPGFARELTGAKPAASPLDSEHFRMTPRTRPDGWWQADRTEIGASTCEPKEIHHERAGCTAAASSGSRYCGSRALFGPPSPRPVSVGVHSGVKPTREAAGEQPARMR